MRRHLLAPFRALKELYVRLFAAVPARWRRPAKGLFWAAVGLLLVGVLGVWQWSALAIAAVLAVVFVPRYGGVTIRGRHIGRFVFPGMILALAIAYPSITATQARVCRSCRSSARSRSSRRWSGWPSTR